MDLLFYGIFCVLQAMDSCFYSSVVKNDANGCAYISPFDTIHLRFLEISRRHKNETVPIKMNQETSALQVYPSKFMKSYSLSTRSMASSLNLIKKAIHFKKYRFVTKKKKQQKDMMLHWFHTILTPLYPFQNFFGFQTAVLFHLNKDKFNQLTFLLHYLEKINTCFKYIFHQKIQPYMINSTHFLKLKYFIKWLWTGNPLDLHIRLKRTSKIKDDPLLYKDRIIVGSHFPQHMHHQYDFAAYDAGARILAYSSSIKNVRAPQRPGYDSYLLAPCTKPIWFVMAFNTQVYIKSIGLVSQEFFSSAFRTIEIFGSDTYPTGHWRLLAVLRAHYDTPKELFNLKSICEKFTSSDCWVKFIRFKVVDYYQIEDYNHCTLNRFQVFGLDVLESLNNKLTHSQETPYAQVYTEATEAPTRLSSIQKKRNSIPSCSEDISGLHSPRIELTHRPHVSSSIPHSDVFLYNLISLSNPKKMRNIQLSNLPFLHENMMIQVPSQNNLYGCYVAHDTMYHKKTQHPDALSKAPQSLNHHVLNNSLVNTDVYSTKQSTLTFQGFSKRESMLHKIFVTNMQDKRYFKASCSPHEHELHKTTFTLPAKRSKENVKSIPPTPPFLLRLVDRLTALETTSKQLTNTTSHLLQGYNSAFDQLLVLRSQMETTLQIPNVFQLESFILMNQTKESSKEFFRLVTFLFLNVFHDFLIGTNVSNKALHKAFQAYQSQNQESWNALLLNPVFVNSLRLKHEYSSCLKLRSSWSQFKSVALFGKVFQFFYFVLRKCFIRVFQIPLFIFFFLQKRQFNSYTMFNIYREMRQASVSPLSPFQFMTLKNDSMYHRFQDKVMCYNSSNPSFQTIPFNPQPIDPFIYFSSLFCEGYFRFQYVAFSTAIKMVQILSYNISFFLRQLYTYFLKPCLYCFSNPHFLAIFYILAQVLIFLLKEITLDRIVFITFAFYLLRSWNTKAPQTQHKKYSKSCVKSPRSLHSAHFKKYFQKLRRKVSKNTTDISHTTVNISSN